MGRLMANEQVNVIDRHGDFYSLPADQLPAALEQGYSVATPEQVHHELTKGSTDNLVGKIVAGTSNAANAMTFGGFDAAYSRLDPQGYDIIQAAREENPYSALAGDVGGLVGSVAAMPAKIAGGVTALGKTVGGAVESGAANVIGQTAAKIPGTAARFAAEGIATAAPKAVTEAVLGDPQEAAETFLAGGAAGLALGGATGALRAGADVLAPGAKAVGKYVGGVADRFKTSQRAKEMGLSKAFQVKAGQSRIQELTDFAEEKGLIKLFNNAKDDLDAVEKATKAAGQEIGEIFKKLDNTKTRVIDGKAILERVEQEILTNVPTGSLNRSEQLAVNRAVNDLKAKIYGENRLARRLSFSEAQEIKSSFGKYAYGDFQQVKPGRGYVAGMERIVDDAISQGLEKAETIFPDVAKNWREAKYLYMNYKDLLKPLKDKAAVAYGNKAFTPSDMAAAAVGAVSGGGPGAIVGYVFNTLRQNYGGALAARAVDFAKSQLNARNKIIDSRIGKFLSNNLDASRHVATAATGRELNRESTDRVREQSARLAALATNPELAATALADSTEAIANVSPEIATHAQTSLIQATKLLLNAAPKEDLEIFAKPSPKLPDATTSAFERKFAVVQDPLIVLEQLRAGTLDPQAVSVLKATYPAIFEKISTSVHVQAAESKKQLSYSKRIALSQLLGRPVDPTLRPDRVNVFQDTFRERDDQKRSGGGRKLDLSESTATNIGRLSGGSSR